MSMIYERYYQDEAREKAGKLSTDQEKRGID